MLTIRTRIHSCRYLSSLFFVNGYVSNQQLVRCETRDEVAVVMLSRVRQTLR